jgi:hypothetical protein
MMRFLSAEEDLWSRTLSGLPTATARVSYLASLANGDGELAHAGLERSYGREVARTTLEMALRQCFKELLRTPVRELISSGTTLEELAALKEIWLGKLNRFNYPRTDHLNYLVGALGEVLQQLPASRVS